MDDHTKNSWQELYEQEVSCRRCARLVSWREEVALKKRAAYRDWDYWGKPMPGFGDPQARILLVGLAPAAHGGNRTGRVFTGDSSGDFLFSALYQFGFANQPTSLQRDDGLILKDLYIAAVCRCAPPDNRPLPEEMLACRPFLLQEIALLKEVQGIVVLGQIAFENIINIYRQKGNDISKCLFGHNLFYSLGEGLPWLLSSYHPSRQNTQTGRLTVEMFCEVWKKARALLSE